MVALLILTWIFKANGWNIPAMVWVAEAAIVMLKIGITLTRTEVRYEGEHHDGEGIE